MAMICRVKYEGIAMAIKTKPLCCIEKSCHGKHCIVYGFGMTPTKLFYLKGLPGYLQLYARYQKPINKDKNLI